MSIRPQSPPLNPLSLLDRIITDAELTPTQYEEVRKSYEAVAQLLQGPNSPVRFYIPSILPQGSMRLGTTIRPVWVDAFDLDMICWLSLSGTHHTPEQVFQWVWDALGQDATYREMRQKMNRCIRLIYKSRPYYLDIIPAIPGFAGSTVNSPLYVPDRAKKSWFRSHPVGFADAWFKPITELRPLLRPLLTANSRAFSARQASVEPLPEYAGFEKTPLQRIVQLVKYDRDKHYKDDDAHRPSSIIVTTLTAHSYSKAVLQEAENLLAFVIRVVEGIPAEMGRSVLGQRIIYSVPNPANTSENFAEKWTTEHYQRFLRWHRRFLDWLKGMENTKGRGADSLLGHLQEEFGNERVVKAASAFGAEARFLHDAGEMRVDSLTGKVGSVGATVAPTIYYGSNR